MTAEDIKNSHEFVSSNQSSNRIKVIGVGGGGNNAVSHMYNQGIRDVSFVIANTDRQALNNSPVPTKVLLGPTVTRGRGAGNKPEVARQAAEESAQEINDLFDDDTDMVFITAGMGGGTGTGAAPVVARIAKERGLLTIGIVTIPFLFEGEKKIIKALDGADEMSKYVDALLVINNDRLSEIYKDLDFINAFGKADDTLSTAAQSISEIITCDGYMNLDFNDVDTTLRNGGTAIISTGYGEGENRVTKAIEDALHSPLLRNTDIFGSKKLLFNLYFSREADQPFNMEETKEINAFVSNIDSQVDVIWGVAFDESLGNKVKFTILAAGFDVTVSDINNSTVTLGAVQPPVVDVTVSTDTQNRLVKEYGAGKIDEIVRTKNEQRYIILRPEQLDEDNVIEALEQNPAYNRDRRVIDSVKSNTVASGPKDKPEQERGSGNNTIDFSDLG